MSRFVYSGVSQLSVPPPPPPPEPDALALVSDFGRHPSITAQPTTGQVALDAILHGGKIYVGYGDWTANTGPIDIAYFDTGLGTWGTALEDAPTEAIDRFRVIDGSVFAPWTDSHVSMPYLGFSTNMGGTWHNRDNGKTGALHIFDAASFTGDAETDLYLCGSDIIDGAGHGIVYRTTDGGITWTLAFDQGSPGGFSRIYSLSKLGAYLYASGSAGVSRFDGTSWSTFTGSWPVNNEKTHLVGGLLASASGWVSDSSSGGYVDPATSAAITMRSVVVDSLGRLWGLYSNHLYIGNLTSGVTWTRVGHLDWDTFQPAYLVPDPSSSLLYVVGASGHLRTAALPVV